MERHPKWLHEQFSNLAIVAQRPRHQPPRQSLGLGWRQRSLAGHAPMNGLIAGALAAIVMWLAIVSPMIRLALLGRLPVRAPRFFPAPRYGRSVEPLRIGR
jgi:hypothetical protein